MLVLTNAVASFGASAPFFKDTMNPADKVEKWAIDKLIPYARNARTRTSKLHRLLQASKSGAGQPRCWWMSRAASLLDTGEHWQRNA